jgi:hypothetical protein
MAHTWTDEELTKFYEGVNAALKKLLRKINQVDSSKIGTAELLEQLSLQSAEVTVTAGDNGIETTVSDLQGRMSSIEQTTDSITLRVQSAETSASEAAASAQSAVSTITQLADSITLSVEEGSKVATISLSVNGETQTAEIDLSGLVTFTDLETSGTTKISGGNIDTESLFAQVIQAAAFSLASSGNTFPSFTLTGKNGSFSISASNSSMAQALTFVQSDGELYIKSDSAIILEPGSDDSGSGYEGVTVNGDLTVTGSISGYLEAGTWTPAVYGATVSSYTRQNGWFVKVGNTVTVGFDLYCTLPSGQTGNLLKISGLPYTPISTMRATGGGECSGYYGAANVLFQGWEISGGYICGKGHTYSSSAGVRYTTDVYCGTSGMLLSGTITYKTAS